MSNRYRSMEHVMNARLNHAQPEVATDRPARGRHRVVIVGGGFGGVYAARGLRKAPVDVTLVDRRNVNVFSPMLYQAATGALGTSEISRPLRDILRGQRNARVILGEATGIDPARREVRLSDGSSLPYDTLVVATGNQYAYFGHDEWRERAPSLKTLEDVSEIRRRVLLAFETAERETDPKRRSAWLTFVVVGGGTTGVELAGAIAELARGTLRDEFRAIDPRDATVVLVEQRERLLPEYPAALSGLAQRQLEDLGVVVRTETTVVDIERGHVDLRARGADERLEARTVLWAAGVRASTFARNVAISLAAATDRRGRIVVEPDLSVPGHPEVLVVGDMAAAARPDGSTVPGVAQGAIQGGRHAARVIAARLAGKPAADFRYRDLGELAMVGRFRVVARLPLLWFGGVFAWLVWLAIHLFYLSGIQNRLLVGVRWAWSVLTRARGSRVITAPHAGQGSLPSVGTLREAEAPPVPAERQQRSAA
jgi:NADH dehydrogenase